MKSLKSIQMLALSKTCDIVNALLLVLDNRLCIKYVNQYAKMVLNWENKEDIIGHSLSEIWQKLGFPPLLDSAGNLIIHEPMAG